MSSWSALEALAVPGRSAYCESDRAVAENDIAEACPGIACHHFNHQPNDGRTLPLCGNNQGTRHWRCLRLLRKWSDVRIRPNISGMTLLAGYENRMSRIPGPLN